MPSVVGQILYEIKDFQTIGTTQILNVYYARQINNLTIPLDADIVAGAFETDVIDQVRTVQDETCIHTTVDVMQLGLLTNFASVPVTDGEGQRTGTPVPNYVAMSVRFIRSTLETRNGRKSIAGMNKEDITQNLFEQTYYDFAVTQLTNAFDGFTHGMSSTDFEFVIMRKTAPGVPEVILPYNQWTYNPISGIFVNRVVKHQVSRTLGRGA